MIKIEDLLKIDPRAKELHEECKRHGIICDANKRWEDGISHHPKAIEIFALLEEADWVFGGDYFCWKSGGDGDNGETLMFTLSILLELIDKRNYENGII